MNWEVRTMKLKVSFCNKTVLRTDISRYAPLWGGYSLMLAVLVLMFLGAGGEDKDWVYTSLVVMFSKRAGQMALINGFYALFVAQALWGDLLAPRMCNSLHAMPVTRDGYFGAHLVAALLFALIPNVLVYGIAALLVPSVVAQAALLTLGAACLQYIFYLGAALVSVQLAGNRVGMVLAYGLVNFLVILLYWFCSEVFVPLIYGLKLDVTWITRICPTVAMYQGSYFEPKGYYNNTIYPYIYQGIEKGELFSHAILCAFFGLVLIGAAQLLYRRRKLEVAGDLLAYRGLSPVFLVLYTLMVAAFVHLGVKQYANGSISQYFFLPLGLLAGYVSGLMLLRRTSRVFRKRLLIPLVGILAMCALAVGATYVDLFGVIRRVPEGSEVLSVAVQPLNSARYVDEGLVLTEQEDIQAAIDYQRDSLVGWKRQVLDSLLQKEGCWTPQNYLNVRLTYKLTNGRTMIREYPLRSDLAAFGSFKKILSRPELIFGVTPEKLREQIDEAEDISYSLWATEKGADNSYFYIEARQGLADAILADCAEGTMLNYDFWNETYGNTGANNRIGTLYISGDTRSNTDYYYYWCNISPDTAHTLRWLESHPGTQTYG